MDKKEKAVRLVDVGELESRLKKDILFCESIGDELSDLENLPTIDPESLRPVAHWEEIPGSYKDHIGKDGSWFVPATRCTNPECREINPCSLKTPFCPMCGARMEDVPHD